MFSISKCRGDLGLYTTSVQKNATAHWRNPTNFAAKHVFSSEVTTVAAAFFLQARVSKLCTDLDLVTLLYLLMLRIYRKSVVEKIKCQRSAFAFFLSFLLPTDMLER